MDLCSNAKFAPLRYAYRTCGLHLVSNSYVPGLSAEENVLPEPDIILELGSEPDWVRSGMRLPSDVRQRSPAVAETADPEFCLTARGADQFFELAYSEGARFVAARDESGQLVGMGVVIQLSPGALEHFGLGQFGAQVGEWYMATVAVAPELHHEELAGLGWKTLFAALVEARLAIVRREGGRKVWVRTRVDVETVRSHYRDIGFHEVATYRVVQSGTESMRVVMTRDLLVAAG